jgi:hypothetical protein
MEFSVVVDSYVQYAQIKFCEPTVGAGRTKRGRPFVLGRRFFVN